MCSCNVLAIKQRKINFGRQRSVVDNLRLVWVIQKGQAGQVLSCKRGELKRENLFLYHSLRKRIKYLLRTVLLAICCLILQIGFPNGANLLLLLNKLDISAPAPLLCICPHLLHPDPAYFQPQQFCWLPCSISCSLLYLFIIVRSFPPPPIPATLVCIQPQLYVFAPLLNIS